MDAETPIQAPDFSAIATREGLIGLDKQFLAALAAADGDLYARLLAARALPDALEAKAEGELIVALGPHLEASATRSTRSWRRRGGWTRRMPASGCSCSGRR